MRADGRPGRARLEGPALRSGARLPYQGGMTKQPTLYGIPNCDTVKRARAWLSEHGHEAAFHDYKKQGVPAARLQAWIAAHGWERLVNRQGTAWRKLDEATTRGIADTLFKEGRIKQPIKSADIYMGSIPWVLMQLVLVAVVIFVPQTVTMFIPKEAVIDVNKVQVDAPPPEEETDPLAEDADAEQKKLEEMFKPSTDKPAETK